jgi:hypothetical protein
MLQGRRVTHVPPRRCGARFECATRSPRRFETAGGMPDLSVRRYAGGAARRMAGRTASDTPAPLFLDELTEHLKNAVMSDLLLLMEESH